MIQLAVVLVALSTHSPTKGILEVSARIPGEHLVVGKEYEIELDVSFAPGLSASNSGVPAPILQIGVPASAELTGKVLATYQEQARNEFLQEPFERLLAETPARIGFTLLRTPKPDDHFSLTILAYVSADPDREVRFVRRRLVQPLVAGAHAEKAPSIPSDWGREDLLQLGDRADLFELPRADGSRVALKDLIGTKNVVVVTYRAYW